VSHDKPLASPRFEPWWLMTKPRRAAPARPVGRALSGMPTNSVLAGAAERTGLCGSHLSVVSGVGMRKSTPVTR
jgi:hypothetical protein